MKGLTKNQTSSPTGWLHMCIWRIEFTEDEKCHNLMSWLISLFCRLDFTNTQKELCYGRKDRFWKRMTTKLFFCKLSKCKKMYGNHLQNCVNARNILIWKLARKKEVKSSVPRWPHDCFPPSSKLNSVLRENRKSIPNFFNGQKIFKNVTLQILNFILVS